MSSAGHRPSVFWQKTISQIPTVFGRLVYLASLRSPATGRYEHFALAQIAGEEESGSILRESHQRVFAAWLSLGPGKQRADLNSYLSALGKNKRTAIETWLGLAPYRHLAPAAATDGERHRYVAGVELLLKLLHR